MEFKIQHFDDLSKANLYDILELRSEVFVVEQNCPYQDCDGKDRDAYHVQYYDQGVLVAYARLLKPGVSYKEYAIGRVIVKESHRKDHLGHKLMETCMNYISETLKGPSIRISAQAYLESFYTRLGFERVSDNYLEDDILHLEMFFVVDS